MVKTVYSIKSLSSLRGSTYLNLKPPKSWGHLFHEGYSIEWIIMLATQLKTHKTLLNIIRVTMERSRIKDMRSLVSMSHSLFGESNLWM